MDTIILGLPNFLLAILVFIIFIYGKQTIFAGFWRRGFNCSAQSGHGWGPLTFGSLLRPRSLWSAFDDGNLGGTRALVVVKPGGDSVLGHCDSIFHLVFWLDRPAFDRLRPERTQSFRKSVGSSLPLRTGVG